MYDISILNLTPQYEVVVTSIPDLEVVVTSIPDLEVVVTVTPDLEVVVTSIPDLEVNITSQASSEIVVQDSTSTEADILIVPLTQLIRGEKGDSQFSFSRFHFPDPLQIWEVNHSFQTTFIKPSIHRSDGMPMFAFYRTESDSLVTIKFCRPEAGWVDILFGIGTIF